ncbi:hypothetical protein [Haliea sp. E17]|uniref:hypothetical protein n=1 Tax=Haliea sp. E17 TaxID=3401576 RepID=UPI003AB0945A
MKKIAIALSSFALIAFASMSQADSAKDCMLEGTVYKSGQGDEQSTKVEFHSMQKYDEDANCRVRRNEKMEFKLPADTRLKEAPSGSTVRYRYQEDKNGKADTQLISVGA